MPRLSRVLARPEAGGLTAEQVDRLLAGRLAQRFVAADGSEVVTQIKAEPKGDVCYLWLAEGELEACKRLLAEQIIPFARAQGCRRLRISGRPGWERVLDGFQRVAVVLEREL